MESLYTVPNTALFHFSDDRGPHRESVENTLFLSKAPGSVIDDPNAFDKTTGGTVAVRPGPALSNRRARPRSVAERSGEAAEALGC